jgi:N-acetylmuramate 1-kinase
MPPEHEALIIFSRQQFPELKGVACIVDPIVKGGSDRKFYRLAWSGGSHREMVLMVYTMARSDNPKFVAATRRLAAHGVRVPSILAFDEDRLCVWMNDLGEVDLFSMRDEPWPIRRLLYQSTLREGAKIHSIREETLGSADKNLLEPPFDEALYLWEQEYFLTHFVQGHLKRDPSAAAFTEAHAALKKLRRHLAKQPRCLVHRDFQSQNILLHEGEPWLVDYQGLRLGLAEYDIASLIYDPYIVLAPNERSELLKFSAESRELSFDQVQHQFYFCAAQRLMQALGAYGNLSRNLGKPHFRQHIPAAVANLTEICHKDPMLEALLPLFTE